ncbi:MAG TPA: caspase family protein [Candidatus Angelobacter sp.]|jgi:hypothetical protein|nr:caspase family protein [Candidatus Angelobacter sp.]
MRAALVVGINAYRQAPLLGAVDDANAVARILATHSNGEPNFSVKLLTVSEDTKPDDIFTGLMLKKAIKKLFDADCDQCLFYFSGHGTITSRGGYIVTPDFQIYGEGISMDEILTLANQSKIKDKVILLDCCHAGAAGAPTITGSNLAVLSEGLSILAACRSSESALEKNGKGVFTSLIVEALRGGAADLWGHVTASNIYGYVDKALGWWEQRPIFRTNVTRFTSLRSATPPVPHETLRKICSYFPLPEKEIPLNPTYESTYEHAQPANVAVMKDLQRYASVGLVVPVGEEYMYFAAINSKSCRLTALGYQYWRLVKTNKI